MKKMLLLLILGSASSALSAISIYVQPRGKQGNGSHSAPFTSLEAARDAIRDRRGADPQAGPFEVVLMDGIYLRKTPFRLEKRDSGLPEAPVVWRAEHPGRAEIIGSEPVPASAYRIPAADRLARLPEAVRPHIRFLDLNEFGLKNHSRLPDRFRMPAALPELFADGKRLTLARWPNQGWAVIDQILDAGSKDNDGSVSDAAFQTTKKTAPRGGTFTYTESAPSRWRTDEGVYLHGFWCFDWFDMVQKVSKIDPAKRTITFAAPHTYGVRKGNPSPRRWRALNVFDELDQPDEYMIDLSEGRLYFWEVPGRKLFLGTNTGSLLQFVGASRITWRGITFSYSQHHCISSSDASHLTIENCLTQFARLKGISLYGGTRNRILGCDVRETGAGGIAIAGGNRQKLTRGDHLIEDTRVTGFSRHNLTYANGIHVTGVGNIVRHCLLSDAPHIAVALSGNDHLFEYNVVSNVCTSSDDAAAFYKGRNPSCRGNVLRFNYWGDIGSPRGHGNAAIYFDDGDGGDFVEGSVFFRCGDPGKGSFGTVFSHGGHDNLVRDCVFIECKRALGSSPWSFPRWKKMLASKLWQHRLLKDVNIEGQTYLTHYPALKGYMDIKPETIRKNWSENNLFVDCPKIISGNWNTNETAIVWQGDPGFVNRAGKDFRFRSDAPFLQKHPHFKVPPIDQMGLLHPTERPLDLFEKRNCAVQK